MKSLRASIDECKLQIKKLLTDLHKKAQIDKAVLRHSDRGSYSVLCAMDRFDMVNEVYGGIVDL